jgi:cytosine/adenosine deaminase-related metal-dependent hydrolase
VYATTSSGGQPLHPIYVLCHGKGAKDLKLDRKVGSLTPGKEADILLLDATALNVAPLNHVPGAVVTLWTAPTSTR